MQPPHSFANTISNAELFAMLETDPQGNEYLRRSFALTRPEFEARRAQGLSLRVAPSPSDSDQYAITLRNEGAHFYRDLCLKYEPLLLNAESFGMDTTHMPSKYSQKSGEPIKFDSISPGESLEVLRTGYGTHERYDGSRKTVMDLTFHLGGKQFDAQDRRWCPVTVNLPGARVIGSTPRKGSLLNTIGQAVRRFLRIRQSRR